MKTPLAYAEGASFYGLRKIYFMKRFFLLTSLISPIFVFSCVSAQFPEPDPLVLEITNKDVNTSITYTPEISKQDYWQSPQETLKLKTGDCEDFAILKASLLPANYYWHLAIVYVQEIKTQHVVLIVNNKYVLDNRIEEVYLFDDMPYDLLAMLPYHSIERPEFFTDAGGVVYEGKSSFTQAERSEAYAGKNLR